MERGSEYIINKPGTAQDCTPLKVQKEQSVLNMQRDTIVETLTKFTIPKNNQRDTQKIVFLSEKTHRADKLKGRPL